MIFIMPESGSQAERPYTDLLATEQRAMGPKRCARHFDVMSTEAPTEFDQHQW
jgi:hypothetical protein